MEANLTPHVPVAESGEKTQLTHEEWGTYLILYVLLKNATDDPIYAPVFQNVRNALTNVLDPVRAIVLYGMFVNEPRYDLPPNETVKQDKLVTKLITTNKLHGAPMDRVFVRQILVELNQETWEGVLLKNPHCQYFVDGTHNRWGPRYFFDLFMLISSKVTGNADGELREPRTNSGYFSKYLETIEDNKNYSTSSSDDSDSIAVNLSEDEEKSA